MMLIETKESILGSHLVDHTTPSVNQTAATNNRNNNQQCCRRIFNNNAGH